MIDVTGRFVAPSGAIFTVPAYFGLDYTVQPGTGVGNSENYLPVALDPPADGIWHVRFSPDEVGTGPTRCAPRTTSQARRRRRPPPR